MKRSIRMMLVALSSIVLCSATACADNDKPIDVSNLPAKAQTTLTTHFNKQKVVLATIEAGIVNKSYDVVLQNGTKLEFDKKGNLTEVDCKQGTVPATSTNTIGEAYRAIHHGYADAIIAGGSEASINALAVGGFATIWAARSAAAAACRRCAGRGRGALRSRRP